MALVATAWCGMPATLALAQPVQLVLPPTGAWAGAAGDNFGRAVAVSGNTAVVGAPFKSVGTATSVGSAHIYVYERGLWTLQQSVVAPDGGLFEGFGAAVAISGDALVVGSPGHRVGSNNSQGCVYVFARSGDSWSLEAQLTAAGGAPNDGFGNSVGISGDTIVVGANGDDVGGVPDQGSATVFVRSQTGWTEQATLTAGDGASGDDFGVSVAIDANTVAVGSEYSSVDGHLRQGAVYVFERTGSIWSQRARLVDLEGSAGDYLGGSVSISGSTLIAGAAGDGVFGGANRGSASIFFRPGTRWSQLLKIAPPDGADGYFGYSVAISGSRLVCGAWGYGASGAGAAFRYSRSGQLWTFDDVVAAPDGESGDLFGVAVAVDGDVSIVGASGDIVGVNGYQGSVWVFGTPIAPCPADLDDDGVYANGAHADRAVTVDDILYFLGAFESGDATVDLDNGTYTGTPDGAVDVNDFLFFVERFEAGC